MMARAREYDHSKDSIPTVKDGGIAVAFRV